MITERGRRLLLDPATTIDAGAEACRPRVLVRAARGVARVAGVLAFVVMLGMAAGCGRKAVSA